MSRIRRSPFSVPAAVAALLLLAPASPAASQALPFHTATGITAGFQENAARAFVGLRGRSGLVRGGERVPDPADRDVDGVAVVAGAILGGPTPLWTVRLVVPWVSKQMTFRAADGRRREYRTSGVGDPLLRTKWIFYRSDRPGATTRIGVQAGVKAPLGRTDARLPTGEVAPRPLQVGTGSWDVPVALLFTNVDGRVGVHANAGWRYNTPADGFEAGDAFDYDLAVGFRFLPWTYDSMEDQTVVAYLELDGRVSREGRVGGIRNTDSGGHVLFLSPDLQWVPSPRLLVEASLQVPLVQDLNGAQLEHEVRFQAGSRIRFSVFR